jgi:hypothetical protein
MHHVLIGKNAAPAVQEKPVQAIFKSIGVDETNKNAKEESDTGRRRKLYRDEHENQARKRRRDQIIPFDSQSLRPVLGPNDAVCICMHCLIKLARSAKARKRRMPWASRCGIQIMNLRQSNAPPKATHDSGRANVAVWLVRSDSA